MKKIAIIVPRFGNNFSGGAESLAKNYSILLSKKNHVTVLTTTAFDYITWKNELKSGIETFQNNIQIIRFNSKKKRNIHSFNKLTRKILKYNYPENDPIYQEWLEEQGPYCPELVEYVKSNHNSFDCFILISYLYYPIIESLKYVRDKSVFVPTLHNEEVAKFPIFKNFFLNDLIYSFNTIEELYLFEIIYGYKPLRFRIIGMSIDFNIQNLKLALSGAEVLKIQNPKSYCIYIGRLDEGKGVRELVDLFNNWNESVENRFQLVIIGKGNLNLKSSTNINLKGYVSESEKNYLIQNCIALINPSSQESFSIVLMEAWLNEKPVIVSGKSEVMKSHCIRSNGGLYFTDQESFSAVMDYLINNETIRIQMGKNGKKYVEKNYNDEVIEWKLLEIISLVAM